MLPARVVERPTPRFSAARVLAPVLGVLSVAALLACSDGPAAVAASQATAAGGVRFTVNSSAGRHPISPFVYGVNQADWSGRSKYLRLGRIGGNRFTAYNWETNASNAGRDYYFQNDGDLGGDDTPGEAVRGRVAEAQRAGASMVVTVPIAGYVAADKNRGGDVAQTPDFLKKRFLESKPVKGRPFQYPPDRGDAVVYQDEFVAWLEGAFPRARRPAGWTIFYSLDNEPELWVETHPRIRPNGKVTYAELMERTIAYASAIKAVVPGALVFGPVGYGWTGFVSLQNAPDADRRNFLDFYLDSLRLAEARTGRRLVDVLDIHWYPEARGGGARVTDDNNAPAVVAARLQAPRSLWDPGYVETSWIAQDAGAGAIRLIPRMKQKIAAHYPGTRLAVTEYNFGGGNHVSGALAQADVLGVFGREDLFAAALWDSPPGTRFIDAAFAAYCNYDGRGGRFGDTSIEASTTDDARSSVYASVDAGRDDRMVLVAINKTAEPLVSDVQVAHPVELARAQAFQVTAETPAVKPGPPVEASGHNAFRIALPASSVVTIVLTQ